jgi:cellulose synthase/poly-beta-1,6-N-acetylglucosamine synthase-like glycosyltransferase
VIVFDVLFAVCALALATLTGYLLLVTAAAFLHRKKAIANAAPLRIALVMPAHNEELQIGACVRRAREVDYPNDRFSIFVIADNCEDLTASVARDAGATAFERCQPDLRGKGQAIDWLLREHAEQLRQFDGIALVDADTQVDSAFLNEISASLTHPEVRVVQGYHGVSNPDAHWRTALTYAGFALVNGLRPAGRSCLGGTSDLKGNGMAFETGLLLEYGWPAHSIVEDIEFSTRLLLDGIVVHFNPDAVVISEMPVTQSQAEPQRRRWESGRLQTVKTFVPSLFRAFLKTLRWRFVDAILELMVPPLSLLVMMQIAVLLLALAVRPAWALFFLCTAAATVFYVVAGLLRVNAPASVWRGLLLTPLFLLWKIPFYLRLVRSAQPSGWERTQRQAEAERDARGEPPQIPGKD